MRFCSVPPTTALSVSTYCSGARGPEWCQPPSSPGCVYSWQMAIQITTHWGAFTSALYGFIELVRFTRRSENSDRTQLTLTLRPHRGRGASIPTGIVCLWYQCDPDWTQPPTEYCCTCFVGPFILYSRLKPAARLLLTVWSRGIITVLSKCTLQNKQLYTLADTGSVYFFSICLIWQICENASNPPHWCQLCWWFTLFPL